VGDRARQSPPEPRDAAGDPRRAAAARIDLPPFYRCTHLSETGSTNDDAKRLATEGAPEGTLIWADTQAAGRGRRGRSWQSPTGNLYVSIVLRPAAPIGKVGQLGFAAALAIAETAASMLPAGTTIACKWPNDVLIGGRKVAGLLLETDMRPDGATHWLVLGVGINVASHPAAVEFPATSLAAEGAQADVAEVLNGFAGHFLTWYDAWRARGFAPLREAWLRRAAGLGGLISVRLEDRTLAGIFAGLDEEGALLLHSAHSESGSTDPRPLRITAGDVFFPAATTHLGARTG
jgi:BirA family biotin operon repressor/biotin-[acetyl-CoA-carboxylase] ligase